MLSLQQHDTHNNARVTDANAQLPSHARDTCSNGHIPSLATCDVSSQQTYQTVNEPNGQLPPRVHLPCTENNGHVPSYVTETSATDSKGRIPSSAVSQSTCHPLCSCDQCQQVLSSDTVDVYCRNERGFSG